MSAVRSKAGVTGDRDPRAAIHVAASPSGLGGVGDAASSSTPPVLHVENLKKYFKLAGDRHVTAVDDISLTVRQGEFLVLLGPSGCGKTTLLRCVAGLDQPDSGRITVGERAVYDSARGVNLPPEKRQLSMVFQTYALWPHMRAAQNVGYPLKARGVPRDEITERVAKVLEMVGVTDQAQRYPNQMSGGQQQRVALARALVAESELILFDEPLSNIDAKVREQLRIELLDMQRSIGFTALYVTHDQAEAMQLAHRVAVLDTGKIAQLGDGRSIYDEPVSRYVAQFIGRANELPGTVVSELDGGVQVDTVLGSGHARATGGAVTTGQEVVVTWRPENCAVQRVDSAPGADVALSFEGEVGARTYVGMHVELIVHAGDSTLLAVAPPNSPVAEGERVRLEVAAGRLLVLPTQGSGD